MAKITVDTNSWVTEAEANEYMSGRIGSSLYWSDGGNDNVPALITAYKWLSATDRFSLPSTATQAVKDAQCEMALFLLQHQPDIDIRMGLRAQGVVKAGIVKEEYGGISAIPLPPVVEALLEQYLDSKPVYIMNVERNEEEGVDYDAYTNLADDV